MRTLDPILKTAYETGSALAIAKVVLHPFALPKSMADLGVIDTADAADSGATYIIRARKSGALVQYNRFTRASYATAANWNAWTTLQTEATNILSIGVFVYTGTGIKRTMIFWRKTGDTNIYCKVSTDEGATWSSLITLISTGDSIDLLQGVHEGGFIYRNATTNTLWLQAYQGSDASWVVNQIPVPDTASAVFDIAASARTLNIEGTSTPVITIALNSEVDPAIGDNRLWITSATDYLTVSATWFSATVIRAQAGLQPLGIYSVFDDYITFTTGATHQVCKLLDYYGITWGYLVPRLTTTTPAVIAYDNTGNVLIYNDGFSSPIDSADITNYTVLEYHATRESIRLKVAGTSTPIDGILYVSRGYRVADTDYYEQLTPYRVLSWKTNPDRTFTIQGVTGYMAIQGRDLPAGLSINATRARTLRLCFAAIGISCTPNNEAIINAQPYPNASPVITSLSAAINRQNNANSIELWNTKYGLRAIATQATASTQTLTPDGGLLPYKDYSQAMGLHPSYLSAGFNTIDRAIEGDGGYPFYPYIHNFAYNPATYNEDLIEDLHEEQQHMGFFHTRANLSIEPGDVVTILSSLIRIIDITETFGASFLQEVRYRWRTEPLNLGDYGITPTETSQPGLAIAPIQAHSHAPNTEEIQDIVGAMFSGNTETGIVITYQDIDGTIDAEVPPTGGSLPGDGWIPMGGTWSFSSADAPTFVISINSDITENIKVGGRIGLIQATTKFFIVTAVGPFSGGATLITVYGGTDYILDNAPISSPNYSPIKKPGFFPTDPTKWTVSASNTSNNSQANPVAATWYNVGAFTISLPIGAWRVYFKGQIEGTIAAATTLGVRATLSTANNSESLPAITAAATFGPLTTLGQFVTSPTVIIVLASRTTHYLNVYTGLTGLTTIAIRGDRTQTSIQAECAYL